MMPSCKRRTRMFSPDQFTSVSSSRYSVPSHVFENPGTSPARAGGGCAAAHACSGACRREIHPVLHCIDGWEDWSMPGNSLALQMPISASPRSFRVCFRFL